MAGKHWPDDSCTPVCFRTGYVWPNLTQSAKAKSDQAWFCSIWSGPSVDEYYTDPESGKLLAGRLRSARTRSDESWTPACFRIRCSFPQNLTRPSRSDLGRFSTTVMIWAFFGRTEPKRMGEFGSGIYDPARLWPQAGRNGHNWP